MIEIAIAFIFGVAVGFLSSFGFFWALAKAYEYGHEDTKKEVPLKWARLDVPL